MYESIFQVKHFPVPLSCLVVNMPFLVCLATTKSKMNYFSSLPGYSRVNKRQTLLSKWLLFLLNVLNFIALYYILSKTVSLNPANRAGTHYLSKYRRRKQHQSAGCYYSGIKYNTLDSTVWNVLTLQTLTTSWYIYENWTLMWDLINYLFQIMSALKYRRTRCQSTRRGCKIMATDATT